MDVAQLVQLLFAGGVGGVLTALIQYYRTRAQNRIEAKTQQDEYSIKLINALNADEGTFRNALLETIRDLRKEIAEERTARQAVEKQLQVEQAARVEIESRLTTTQNQLTVITGERDLFDRQLQQAKADLAAAHEKIRLMQAEIDVLRAQQHHQE